jgi:hypothetical protein
MRVWSYPPVLILDTCCSTNFWQEMAFWYLLQYWIMLEMAFGRLLQNILINMAGVFIFAAVHFCVHRWRFDTCCSTLFCSEMASVGAWRRPRMKVYDYNQEFGGNYYQARKNDIKTLLKGQFKGDFCRSFQNNFSCMFSCIFIVQ